MTAIRPRRSVLYMPGANERALEKAKTLPADVKWPNVFAVLASDLVPGGPFRTSPFSIALFPTPG